MKRWFKENYELLKETVVEFIDDDPLNYAASIAFYTIFSLPAILIISIVIAGSFYEDQEVKQSIIGQIQQVFGPSSADQVLNIMENAHQTSSSTLAKILGIATLIFSGTTVFASLQNGINSIWGIKPKPKRGYIKFVVDRILSFAMVISIGFLLLVSLLVDALLSIFDNVISDLLSGSAVYVITFSNLIFSAGVVTLIFAMIFKVLPDAKIKWKDVWRGAIVTTILFIGGKFLIGLYLSTSTLANAYGAAGSLVLLLIWVYYSAVILLFGAEFTYVYSRLKGRSIKASKKAVRLKKIEIEKED